MMAFMWFLGFLVFAFLTSLVFRKAGYSGIQVILVFIPFVNLIVLIWFALTEWPIQKELRELKMRNVTPE